jgi:hypothetical protein
MTSENPPLRDPASLKLHPSAHLLGVPLTKGALILQVKSPASIVITIRQAGDFVCDLYTSQPEHQALLYKKIPPVLSIRISVLYSIEVV